MNRSRIIFAAVVFTLIFAVVFAMKSGAMESARPQDISGKDATRPALTVTTAQPESRIWTVIN